MVKWRFANVAIIGSLIVGSGFLVVMSPGWQAVLAQAGYYRYGAATTMWLVGGQWKNSAGFIHVFGASRVLGATAEAYCGGSGGYSSNVRPGPYLDLRCADASYPSKATTMWLVNGRWVNGAGTYGPDYSSSAVLDSVAETYCMSHGQQVNTKTFRQGPYLDILCGP